MAILVAKISMSIFTKNAAPENAEGQAVNEGWLDKWVLKDFRKVKNPDMWQRFLELYRRHRVTFHWLKGHAGHPENERCDKLAVAAYQAEGLPEDTGYLASLETTT